MPERKWKANTKFLSKHNDASLNDGTDAGLQSIASTNGGDGFFYARLVKKV